MKLQYFDAQMLWKVSANEIYESKFWAQRSKIVKQYRQAYVPQVKKILKPVVNYPVKISYYFLFKGTALDSTNCFYMAKLLEDCMVKAGILRDDAPKYVKSSSVEPRHGSTDWIQVLIEEPDQN